MKKGLINIGATIIGTQAFACLAAMAAVQYDLTVTNGSGMPLSPAVVFVKNGDASAAKIGEAPSAGLVKLCQTGNGTDRMNELKKMSGVSGVTQTTGPILPGETRTLTVSVKNPREQSIQLETMYGKTKDVCGVVSVGSHSLYGLKAHVASELQKTDEVIATGAFLDPALPEYPATANACEDADSAAGCLRELALPNTGAKKVRFFPGYLPTVVSHIEHQFGAEETQSLLIPTSGAIRVDVKLKH